MLSQAHCSLGAPTSRALFVGIKLLKLNTEETPYIRENLCGDSIFDRYVASCVSS